MKEAYKAFEGLVRKGILESQEPIEVELNELELSPSNVIKTQTEESFEKVTFNTLAGVSNKLQDSKEHEPVEKVDEETFNLFAEYKTQAKPNPIQKDEPKTELKYDSLNELIQPPKSHIKEQPKSKVEPQTVVQTQPVVQAQREDVEIDIQVLRNLIDEVVSDKALRILLNIADGNIDLIRKKYAIAKASQLMM